MKYIVTLIAIAFLINSLYAMPNADSVYVSRFKTVQLHVINFPLRNPVIELNGNEQLVLKFDELSPDIENYEYKVIACNADWTNSMMFPYEFIEGFQTANIFEYRPSATLNRVQYVHYWVNFPNEQMAIKKSGNYVIKVFKAGYEDSVVLCKRFMVYEQLVEPEMFIQRPMLNQYTNSHQEVRFDIQLNRYVVQNAIAEISVTLMQNFRFDNAIQNITPVFINESILRFRREGKYVFPAVKEFRYFDSRDMLIRNERIKAYDGKQRDTIYLFADMPRRMQTYVFMNDMNGRYFTGVYGLNNAEWEASYVNVVFELSTGALYKNGEVYLFGKLTDWQMKPENKMQYDSNTKSYYVSMLLKQALYNYVYVYEKENNKVADTNIMEGNFFETENEYQLLVYHKPVGSRYDRLIAYKTIDNFGNQRP
jgi:hypothetical protein